jgi:hypothetical protein
VTDVTHTVSYARAYCPKCGWEMRLSGDYFIKPQLCGGCHTLWDLSEEIFPSGRVGWTEHEPQTVYIAPDNMSAMLSDGPFKKRD